MDETTQHFMGKDVADMGGAFMILILEARK